MKTVLYRYYNDNKELLYVGITGDQSKRFSAHNRSSEWMQLATTAKLEHYATRGDAKAAETKAIKEENPIYNIAESLNSFMNKSTLRLSPQMHLLQMINDYEEGFDSKHELFSEKIKLAFYSIPEDSRLDWKQMLYFSFSEVIKNHKDDLPNLYDCDSCIQLYQEADKTILGSHTSPVGAL